MQIEWSAEEAYILGKATLNRQFKKLSDQAEWIDGNRISIIHPILEEGVIKGKASITCNAEKRNGETYISECTIVIPKLTDEEAKLECEDEIETSYPTEWLDKYGEYRKEKAVKACIQYKTSERPDAMKKYYEKYLEAEIAGLEE